MATDRTAMGAALDRKALLVSRLSGDYILRFAECCRPIFGSDLMRALVFLAILQANVSKVTGSPELNARYGHDEAPPDEMRQPVSALSIAASLSMPRETARRYVDQLIKLGLARRVGHKGVIIPLEVVSGSPVSESLKTNYANVRRFLMQLNDAGVIQVGGAEQEGEA